MANTFTKASKSIWAHRRRFSVGAANDTNRYFEQGIDTADSMAKWDAYDSSPTSIGGGNVGTSPYIIPINCYLASYEALIYSNSANDRPSQIEIYYGSPTLETLGNTTSLTLATVTNGATSHDVRRVYERIYEDWGNTISLSKGDIVLPTVKSNYDGLNSIVGGITILFKER